MSRRIEPLDAGERELADLLARDVLPGPSPQLDARILAAARAATKPSTGLRRPRPRWIAGMSIAATLVLAVGIAWRLRPLPPRAPAASEAHMAEMRAVNVVAPSADIAAPPPSAPPADVAYPRMQPQVREAKAVPPERETAAARDEAPPEPPVVFDAPSPIAAPAPPPAPPVQSTAPAAVAPEASAMAAKAQAPAAPAPNAFESERPREDARTLDKVEVSGSRIPAPAPQAYSRDNAARDAAAAADAAAEDGVSRAMLDDEPPATADSPQVRDAWLQRIRELLSAGETEAARNSLAEFRKRYPKYALPEDLRRFVAP